MAPIEEPPPELPASFVRSVKRRRFEPEPVRGEWHVSVRSRAFAEHVLARLEAAMGAGDRVSR
jgi:hypothetical protein